MFGVCKPANQAENPKVFKTFRCHQIELAQRNSASKSDKNQHIMDCTCSKHAEDQDALMARTLSFHLASMPEAESVVTNSLPTLHVSGIEQAPKS